MEPIGGDNGTSALSSDTIVGELFVTFEKIKNLFSFMI